MNQNYNNEFQNNINNGTNTEIVNTQLTNDNQNNNYFNSINQQSPNVNSVNFLFKCSIFLFRAVNSVISWGCKVKIKD